jgi:hypothetical protein
MVTRREKRITPSGLITSERVIPLRTVGLLALASGIGLAGHHFPSEATSVVLALVAFNALDQLTRSVRRIR